MGQARVSVHEPGALAGGAVQVPFWHSWPVDGSQSRSVVHTAPASDATHCPATHVSPLRHVEASPATQGEPCVETVAPQPVRAKAKRAAMERIDFAYRMKTARRPTTCA